MRETDANGNLSMLGFRQGGGVREQDGLVGYDEAQFARIESEDPPSGGIGAVRPKKFIGQPIAGENLSARA